MKKNLRFWLKLPSLSHRASDKKIKLEIALKEATEFHDALQAFVDWLTSAEKTLGSAKPVSRVMETLLGVHTHNLFSTPLPFILFPLVWAGLVVQGSKTVLLFD